MKGEGIKNIKLFNNLPKFIVTILKLEEAPFYINELILNDNRITVKQLYKALKKNFLNMFTS